MAAHPSSVALRDELATPTHVDKPAIKVAMRQLRPFMARLTQQMGLLQQLIAVAEEDEPNPIIVGKFENMKQTFHAVQRQLQNTHRCLDVLSGQLRRMDADGQNLISTVDGQA